jgi:IS5 family transposase
MTMADMTQMTFGLDPLPKKTRKEVFLDEMNLVVPWGELVALIQPHARGAHQALGGRPPFAIETMLRIHCLQLWWNLSDPAMEEELHERPLYRRFAGLQGAARMPDEHHPALSASAGEARTRPEDHGRDQCRLARQGLMLKTGTVVDATIIAAPSSSKNNRGERPADAPDQEGQAVALRDEGAHWRGCPIGSGAHGHWHGGQRQ